MRARAVDSFARRAASCGENLLQIQRQRRGRALIAGSRNHDRLHEGGGAGHVSAHVEAERNRSHELSSEILSGRAAEKRGGYAANGYADRRTLERIARGWRELEIEMIQALRV